MRAGVGSALTVVAFALLAHSLARAAEDPESIWSALKDSRDISALVNVEEQLRGTPFGELARQRIETLKREQEDQLYRQANHDPNNLRPPANEMDSKPPVSDPSRMAVAAPKAPATSNVEGPLPPKENLNIATAPPAETLDRSEIAARIQGKLRDGGCYSGPVDGKWGSKSTEALQKFVELAKLDLKSSEPSKDVLDRITLVTRRVCPLEAKPEQKEDERPAKKVARTTKEEDAKEPVKPLAKPKAWIEEEKKPRKSQETTTDTNNPTRRKAELELGKERVDRICKNALLSPGRRVYLGCK